jgi:hypothetical protein
VVAGAEEVVLQVAERTAEGQAIEVVVQRWSIASCHWQPRLTERPLPGLDQVVEPSHRYSTVQP